MCGIAGIISKKARVESGHIKAMADALRHRGPDDEGYIAISASNGSAVELIGPDSRIAGRDISSYSDNAQCMLAHRRLSIIDLSPAGHQPMAAARSGNWIVFNGEIYNYIELRNELIGLGRVFHTNTDTEVLLAAYEEWGPGCLSRLNGMWAFVVYDAGKKSLFGARDRFGVKPIYYINNNGSFAFASEMKALLALPSYKRKINDEAAFDYLVAGIEENGDESLFSGIFELKPSTYFECALSGGPLSIKKYYTLSYDGARTGFDEGSAREFVASTKRRIYDAVRLRLRSDVPVGTCLSGGIDSSAIVCVINDILKNEQLSQVGDRQKVFTASYDMKDIDESAWAELVASRTRTDWIRTYPKPADLAADLEDLVYTQDIPFGSTSIYAQYRVMKLASDNGVKVLLDGQGGDELFTGYQSFYTVLFAEKMLGADVPGFLSELRSLGNSPVTGKFIAKSLLRHMASGALPVALLRRFYAKKTGAAQYFDRGFYNMHSGRLKALRAMKHYGLNTQMHYAMTSYGLKALLKYEDRNSMRFSIESRTPFADDINLIEGTFGIPGAYKIHNGWSKYLLRESMRGVIPDATRERTDKIGFATPERRWLTELQDVFRSYITQEISGYVDSKALLDEWNRFLSGPYEMGQNAWRIINFAVWKKVYGL